MKVGDYVRTKDGYIAKIEKEFDESYLCDDMVEYIYEPLPFIRKDKLNEMIIKSSPNIIDLIKVGDYVNGLKVSSVGGTYYGRKDKAIYCDYCENKETGKWTMIYDDEIKSIVTKEQFESVEYKVGE